MRTKLSFILVIAIALGGISACKPAEGPATPAPAAPAPQEPQ
jgi:hypothetical protein